MTRCLAALGSSRTLRLHVSPHPAFDRMRFLFTMSEIEGLKERRRIEILIRRPLAFVTLSAHTLNESDESHRERIRSASICSTRRQDLGAQTLVEPDGIEPTTSCLQSTRSPN